MKLQTKGSNGALLCSVEGAVDPAEGAAPVLVIHKPEVSERPLWDFPDGTLAARERAAYLLSEALGWDVVPLTVLRDGPHGAGMVQQWCDPVEPDDTPDPVDVVPAGPDAAWRDGSPWSGRVVYGDLLGRGTCDMKGGLVAAAWAVRALRRAGAPLRGDVLLASVQG